MKTENELIAEFMGLNPYHDSRYGKMWPDPSRKDNPVVMTMLYEKSWDWLIPVVEKIEGLRIENKMGLAWCFSCDISVNACDLRSYSRPTGEKFMSFSFFVNSTTSKIGTVYKAVIDFIHWYNQQPK